MKKLTIENFRCFSNLEVNFRRQFNLIIGDNASGKTSLLSACKYVMSSFFSGFSTEYTKWISPNNDDFISESTDGIIGEQVPLKLSFDIDKDIFPELKREQILSKYNMDKIQTLQKNSSKNSRAQVSGIADFKKYGDSLRKCYTVKNLEDGNLINEHPLPLFSLYSAVDIPQKKKIKERDFVKYSQPRSFAYYECLDANRVFKHWKRRILALTEANILPEEVDTINRAICDVLGENGCNVISGMKPRPISGGLYFSFIDGREVEYSLLSDGYKRIVNIVIDIAERCAILNRRLFKGESARETRGMVLIDEIDMHLHPSMQATIIKGLKNAFPKIQFIVSTHAPMVMSGFKSDQNNVCYKLSYNIEDKKYEASEISAYGMDISSVSKLVLDVTPRAMEVQRKLDDLFEAIADEKWEEAEMKLAQLKAEFKENIYELVEAETMMNLQL